MNQKFIKSYSKNVFDKTFSVTDALSKAMIIVASLTIFTALMTLAEVRLENLAPLWALGISRIHLLKFELLQCFLLLSVTLLVALPAGMTICYFLTNFLNVAAFGWKLPLTPQPKAWFEIIFMALVATLSANVIPALLLFKNSPSTMIKRYRNDL